MSKIIRLVFNDISYNQLLANIVDQAGDNVDKQINYLHMKDLLSVGELRAGMSRIPALFLRLRRTHSILGVDATTVC